MNTKQKGQKKELLCAKKLASEGYFIAFRSFTVKRGPCFVGVDFADTFDVVGIKSVPVYSPWSTQKPEFYRPHWKFVSCSFSSHRAEKVTAVEEFRKKYALQSLLPKNGLMEFEVWLWNKARFRGRGKDKYFDQAHWEIIQVY